MADFNIRSESIDVEQIMRQIRSRIQEKRGVDYTEEQIRELASVRLEKFLDPKNLRSDLIEQFRRSRQFPPGELGPIQPPYEFSDQTLFTSHRGLLRFIRRLLNPVLKLFFNPNTLNQVLHAQAQFNSDMLQRDRDWQTLYYEVLHNLVLETTRSGIELRNMKMRLEALSSRLEFSERRVRALEGVVQYRPEIVRVTRPRSRATPRAAGPTGDRRGPGGFHHDGSAAGGWRTGVRRPGRVKCFSRPRRASAPTTSARASWSRSRASRTCWPGKFGADSRGAACGRYPR